MVFELTAYSASQIRYLPNPQPANIYLHCIRQLSLVLSMYISEYLNIIIGLPLNNCPIFPQSEKPSATMCKRENFHLLIQLKEIQSMVLAFTDMDT